jgi:hypothetical protein
MNTTRQIISNEDQKKLVAAYQASRAAAEVATLSGKAVDKKRAAAAEPKGTKAASDLMECLSPLVRVIADEQTTQRLGHEWGLKEREESRAEAMVVAMEALSTYDSSKGVEVSQWVSKQVRQHMTTLEYDSGGGARPREWRRVAKVAHTAIEKRKAAGLSLSTKAISDDVMAYFVSETYARVIAENPEMTEEEAMSAVHSRLSRQSILRVITNEMPELLMTSAGAVSLDCPLSEGEGDLHDQVQGSLETSVDDDPVAIVRSMLGTMHDTDVDSVLMLKGDVVPQEAATAYASSQGITMADARVELRGIKSRMTAPHAQFAALAEEVDWMFESESEAPVLMDELLVGYRDRLR